MIKIGRIVSTVHLLTLVVAPCPIAVAGSPSSTSVESLLQQPFDLASQRSSRTQYYRMETKLVAYAPDGRPTSRDTYRLLLRCVPGSQSGEDVDEYMCGRFTLQQGDSPEVGIPALAGWTYPFKRTTGIDEKGQVFGIDHAKFEGLTDSSGVALPPDKAYLVYNSFIDFHAFCNEFSEPTTEGGGIQDLTRIGQKVVHASAFSEPPVSLGSNVAEGSTFKNGEITLAFKGLSLVDNAPCALIGFDSGQSSFKMFLEPVPNMKITTVGGSHYQGDIYIDLQSRWVRKVMMTELDVSETVLPVPPNKINVVHERSVIIKSVTAKVFSQE